jgi:UDP-N-acetylmuramate dehydrogenase
MEIQRNISLKKFTSFKIGGPARYFVKVSSLDDFEEAISFAEKKKLKVFVLGGGSNILVSDNGFDGLIIKNEIADFEVLESNSDWQIKAGSGLPLAHLISFGVENNLKNIGYLAGIPGTLGGAIFGNAGAFRHSISEFVEKVEIFDLITKKKEVIEKQALKFNYRSSILQEKKNWFLLNAYLKLQKDNSEDLRKIVSEILEKRKEKQPLEFPSAGSIFKNIPLEEAKKEVLKREKFLVVDGFVPAGFLIEKLGLKGLKKGDAMFSEKHANFIINLGEARARDVKFLIDLAREKAKERYQIKLKEEIRYLGEF